MILRRHSVYQSRRGMSLLSLTSIDKVRGRHGTARQRGCCCGIIIKKRSSSPPHQQRHLGVMKFVGFYFSFFGPLRFTAGVWLVLHLVWEGWSRATFVQLFSPSHLLVHLFCIIKPTAVASLCQNDVLSVSFEHVQSTRTTKRSTARKGCIYIYMRFDNLVSRSITSATVQPTFSLFQSQVFSPISLQIMSLPCEKKYSSE